MRLHGLQLHLPVTPPEAADEAAAAVAAALALAAAIGKLDSPKAGAEEVAEAEEEGPAKAAVLAPMLGVAALLSPAGNVL